MNQREEATAILQAALNGELTPENEARFEQLLANHPEIAALWIRENALAVRLHAHFREVQAAKAADRIDQPVQVPSKAEMQTAGGPVEKRPISPRKMRWFMLRPAWLAFTFLLGLGWLLWVAEPPTPEAQQVQTQPPPILDQVDPGTMIFRDHRPLEALDGMSLQSGDRIVTDEAGSCTLVYPANAARVKLESASSAGFFFQGTSSRIHLETGRLNCWVNPRRDDKDPFFLNAGRAEVKVIGTRFHLETSESQTKVEVFKGTVQLKDRVSGEAVNVNAGEFGKLDPNQGLSAGPFDVMAENQPEPKTLPEKKSNEGSVSNKPIEVPKEAPPPPEEQGIYHMLLDPLIAGNRFQTKFEPRALVTREMVKSKYYYLSTRYLEENFDAPFRKFSQFLLDVDRRFQDPGPEDPTIWQPLEMATVSMVLAQRSLDGTVIDDQELVLRLGTHEEVGQGVIRHGEEDQVFSISELKTESGYRTFLSRLVKPFENKAYSFPDGENFLVTLHYRWPKFKLDHNYRELLLDYFPRGNADFQWTLTTQVDTSRIRKPDAQKAIVDLAQDLYLFGLTNTFAQKKDGKWFFHSNAYLAWLNQSLAIDTQAWRLMRENKAEEAIPLLSEYFQRMPSDHNAARNLLTLYQRVGRHHQASRLIETYQPFFITPRPEQMGQKKWKRRKLDLNIRQFQPNNREQALLRILSPVAGDRVAGATPLKFIINSLSPILRIDCFENGKFLKSLESPPFQAEFNRSGKTGKIVLRVIAYFEDRTFLEEEVAVESLALDEGQSTNLVEVQLVARKRNGEYVQDLDVNDFRILENGVDIPENRFRPLAEPLTLAVLIDTSLSMAGTKQFKAQLALREFLDKLGPRDRVTLYTFNERVVNLGTFRKPFDKVDPVIFSLHPHSYTTLYDALLIAARNLNEVETKGSRALLVLTDGRDAGSLSNQSYLLSLMEASPIRVYAMHLDEQQPSTFLEKLSEQSGSFSRIIDNDDELGRAFDAIYRELTSLFYLNFYSPLENKNKRNLKLRSQRRGVRLRWMSTN